MIAYDSTHCGSEGNGAASQWNHSKRDRKWQPVSCAGLRAVQPQNRTASPVEGAVSSPSHITLRPRTKVPTGQPVTVFPS
jgi:hypothetical protein